jgi:hypothetical protein
MPPLPAPVVAQRKHDRSQQLLADSWLLIVSAYALIAASRRSMARQRYVRIVCAWCQQTIRFVPGTGMARWQVSHSICYDCFAPVFRELEPGTAPPKAVPKPQAGECQ